MDARRELYTALTPEHLAQLGIHDIDAAAECPSSTHPTPGDPEAAVCACQKSAEERERHHKTSLDELSESSQQQNEMRRKEQESLPATAKQLGVTLEQTGGYAPYQIVGTVDGMRFYLRERHGEWTIQVPDEEGGPDGDPSARPTAHTRLPLHSQKRASEPA